MHPRRSETNRARNYDTRQKRGASRTAFSGPNSKLEIDKFVILPILACVFATMVTPLLDFMACATCAFGLRAFANTQAAIQAAEPSVAPRIFWPVMAAVSVVLAVQHRSRLRGPLPPHIICLLAYLALAGASVLWAFRPESSLIRFAQQVMIVTSILLPAMLAAPTADIMRGLFLWCFAPAAILNIFFVFENSPAIVAALKGYPGFFLGKNYLGEFSAIAFLLALYETLCSGRRRALGVVVTTIALWLLFWSNSKTAFGLALVAPLLAGLVLIVKKVTRISPAMILLSIPLCFVILSSVSNFNIERISYMLYGDSSLTGRTVIWDFANSEIARRPLLGWGYQSFWLVPGSPAIADAIGWVKAMPDGHNGYVDTKLELGYAGLGFLLVFIIATLHGVGRVADRQPARAWLMLSLALFVIVYNFTESLWMRGFEFLWVVFLVVAAEIARYWHPLPLTKAAYRPKPLGPGVSGPPRGARMPRPGIRMS
jgi:exopolysaccharide production protein ExoQ